MLVVLLLSLVGLVGCDTNYEPEAPTPAGQAQVCGFIEPTDASTVITVVLGGSKETVLDRYFEHSKDYVLAYTATTADDAIRIEYVRNDLAGVPMRVRSNFELGTFVVTVTADDSCDDSPDKTVQLEVEVIPLQ
ncbi:MAG: hypothetical protein AAGF99_16730 [Bacteroidota bacterium]